MKLPRDRRKLIFVRDGFPFKGGSSTFLYLLFQTLQHRLPRSEYWNVVLPPDLEFGSKLYGDSWKNPRRLEQVRTFLLNGRDSRQQVTKLLKEVRPDGVVSKSRVMTILFKRANPDLWVDHITSTCGQIKEAIARGELASVEEGFKRIRGRKRIPRLCPEEEDTVRLADRIIFHSDSMRFWYWYFYPEHREKMHDEVFWDYPILKKYLEQRGKPKPWQSRTVDVLFAATNWHRPEKNFELLRAICKRLDLKKKRVAVVGVLPEKLPREIMQFPVVSQDELYYLMCDARVFVCPSRYDEAPNVVFEAGLAKCNIVCSVNCGNFRMTPETLRAALAPDDFVRKIRQALRKPQRGAPEAFEAKSIASLF